MIIIYIFVRKYKSCICSVLCLPSKELLEEQVPALTVFLFIGIYFTMFHIFTQLKLQYMPLGLPSGRHPSIWLQSRLTQLHFSLHPSPKLGKRHFISHATPKVPLGHVLNEYSLIKQVMICISILTRSLQLKKKYAVKIDVRQINQSHI